VQGIDDLVRVIGESLIKTRSIAPQASKEVRKRKVTPARVAYQALHAFIGTARFSRF
jgi:hypothetical protein